MPFKMGKADNDELALGRGATALAFWRQISQAEIELTRPRAEGESLN